jgi:hypothetical protein
MSTGDSGRKPGCCGCVDTAASAAPVAKTGPDGVITKVRDCGRDGGRE